MYNYFSENARIKFIPIDADVSGVVMAYFCFIFQFPHLICYGLVDWLIRYPMTAVVSVVFTSCPTRGGQQGNQFNANWRCFSADFGRFRRISVFLVTVGGLPWVSLISPFMVGSYWPSSGRL